MNAKFFPIFVLAGWFFSGLASAQNLTLEQRLMRVENLLANQSEQLQKSDQLRTELSEIRELLEKQSYDMEQIKQRQRNLFQDMDRRLSELESAKSASGIHVPAAVVVAPEVASVPAAVLAPVVSSAETDGKEVYEKAFALLKDGRHAPAITAFRQFMQQYPQSKLQDNAQYWLAEACYGSRDYPAALKEFQKVLSQHKDSDKLPAAELKVGYTYYEMQNWEMANTTLDSVVSRYPKTTEAAKATERLQKMKREGH